MSMMDDEVHNMVVTRDDVQQWNLCWILENDALKN